MNQLPKLLLSTRSLLGIGQVDSSISAPAFERFQNPADMERVFDQAAEYGIKAVLSIGETAIMQPLRAVQQRHGTLTYPIIPNIPSYVREAGNYGLVGAGLRRLRRLGLLNLARLGSYHCSDVLKVLQRDFNTAMSIFFDVEMAEFRPLHPPAVFLDGQITDLCVAFDNKELLLRFAESMHDRYRTEPGLVTHNLGFLVAKLQAWHVPIQLLIAPFNQQGFAMKPNPTTCEALLQQGTFTFVADRISVGARPCAATYAYLRAHGIRCAILDVTERADLELAHRLFLKDRED